MKENNLIVDKSFAFAVRIVKLYQYLNNEKNKNYEIAGQILASGTSVGSNIEEAVGGISKKDFVHRMGIAYKEARETRYWLRLLHETAYIDKKIFDSLLSDCEEIIKILTAIIKSSKA